MKKVLLAVRLHPQTAYIFRRFVGYAGRTLSDCLEEALGMYLRDATEQWKKVSGEGEVDRIWAKWNEGYRKKYLEM